MPCNTSASSAQRPWTQWPARSHAEVNAQAIVAHPNTAFRPAWQRSVLGIIGCVLVSACAGVNTRTADGQSVRMTREEFAAYVEKTFRYQNRVVNDLIMVSSLADDGPEYSPELIAAEEDMATQCRALNDMVSATIEGRELSMLEKLKLPEQVPACEAAARRVEEMMGRGL